MSILFLFISLLTTTSLKCVNSCLSDPYIVRFKYIASFNFFVGFIDLSSIDRPYIKKLTEQHDHNMQLKKKENKLK
jgi:hypothetical protein